MFKKILLGAALALTLLVAVFAGAVAMQPSDFRVTRSATMSASAAEVFAQVNDFHCWDAWSPWAKLDPNATTSFEGASQGEGAVFRWAGNDEVGEGSMTIVESRPSEFIQIRLEFVKPFAGVSTAEFAFQDHGDQTAVTWSMYGKNDFVGKAVSLFMDCDAMMGGEFEKGLANMKAVVEAPQESEATAAALHVEPADPELARN